MATIGDIKERQAFYPQGQALPLAEHPFYTSSFSIANKIPAWDAYRRTPGREIKTVHRDGTPVFTVMLGRFHPDPMIKGSLDASAYDGSGYDTGHLCPAEAMQFDRSALADTFLTSNAMPQAPGLNRGPWKTLEEKEAAAAKAGMTLNVLTGPFFANSAPKRLASGLAVPDACWKVIADEKSTQLAAYIMPNAVHPASDIDLYRVPLEKISQLTGLKFPAWRWYINAPGLLDYQSFKLDNSNPLQIEDLQNGEYILLRDYLWNPWDAAYPNAKLIIPKGFATDFGSIPQVFSNIYPKIGTFRDKDFLGHDWLYGTEYFNWRETAYKYVLNADDNRAECDMRLLESLKGDGDNWISRNTIWSAVKIGGGAVWSDHTQESINANRALLTT